MGLETLSPPLNSLSRVVLILFKILKNYLHQSFIYLKRNKNASRDGGVFNNYENAFSEGQTNFNLKGEHRTK